MTSDPAPGNTEELTFRHFSGAQVHSAAVIDSEESRTGDFLTAREVRLDDSTRLTQVWVAAGPHRDTGYERLDNEILAGRRLHDVAKSVGYPASASFLYGDEAESADPYALLRPYQGKPLSAVVSQMLEDEQHAFEASLLRGLCWLAAAGIAHRGLSPSTVRWDSRERQAQITDFSLCTVFGAPRKGAGSPDQPARRSRPDGRAAGLVTNRDDMYAAGLLIYYVYSQGDDSRPDDGKLTEMRLSHLVPLLGPPEGRPTAREVLASHLGEADPVPRRAGADARLAGGYASFEFWWGKKSPGRTFPEDPRDRRAAPLHPVPSPAPPPSVTLPHPPLAPPPHDAAQAGPVAGETAWSQGSADWIRRRGWRRGDSA
jgi:serine/threonine protein kinase